MTRIPISDNAFSHDMQVKDAWSWLNNNDREAFADVDAVFPEFRHLVVRMYEIDPNWAWLDTGALGVDAEYTSWLAEAIEDTGLVWWEDGEPWTFAP